MNVSSTSIQILSSMYTNQTYGIQLSSIIDLENGRTKYQMQKSRNLLEWDQRTMVTNMWIKMVSALTCKVKGLTLDYNTSQLIHFHRMLEWAKSTCRGFKETVDY